MPPVYFANPSTPRVRAAMRSGLLGAIATPAQGNRITGYPLWAADNGCYGKGYPGDAAYLAWLDAHADQSDRCAFATAPDVVADAAATLDRSVPFLSAIRARGYPVALVAQDGLERLTVPWQAFDVLFLGGSTVWKLGAHARRLADAARARGKRVHMGRVNSLRRYRYADAIGCHSVDGTYIAFGPDLNLTRCLGWHRAVEQQPTLWEMTQ